MLKVLCGGLLQHWLQTTSSLKRIVAALAASQKEKAGRHSGHVLQQGILETRRHG